MADVDGAVLTALRRYVAQRRQEIADKFPKKLEQREYDRTCGRHEEVEAIAKVMQDAVRKANSTAEVDDDPDTP